MRKVLFACLLVNILSNLVEGWSCAPKKLMKITRKNFVAGLATGLVLGTTATAAGTALAIDQTTNNSGKKKEPYEPPAGSLNGKIILITGGSTGLGLESAKRLAAAGATIVLTSRNAEKGEKSVDTVKSYLKEKGMIGAEDDSKSKMYSLVLDLDDLDSVKSFPKSYSKLGLGDIDVLMNNAGVMAIPDLQVTKDGYERTFQSNHLGHFVLTSGLYPYLSRKKATIINVSSEAYQFTGGKFDIDNLNGEKKYGPWSSYGLSKLSNILFTTELQRRANENFGNNSWLTAVTLHPGAVQTDLGRYLVGEEKWNDLKKNGPPSGLQGFALNAASKFTLTVPEGASTQVFLASGANDNLIPGAFYENEKVKKLPPFATDGNSAKELWAKSEELGGIIFDLNDSPAEVSKVGMF